MTAAAGFVEMCNDDRSFVDKHRLEQTQSTRFRLGRRDVEEMTDRKGSGSGWRLSLEISVERREAGAAATM
uniref:Uncharacterized protein n=1 Tax=Cucumis melo TaxID=3656 RepID=A0A9I9D7D6_CUCME